MNNHNKANNSSLSTGIGVKFGEKYSAEVKSEQATRSHTLRSLFFAVAWDRTTDLENVPSVIDDQEKT